MTPALAAAVKDTLLDMTNNEAGRKVLAEFEETTKFDEFPQGSDAALAPIRDFDKSLDEGRGQNQVSLYPPRSSVGHVTD